MGESNGHVYTYPGNCGDPDNIKGYNWCFTDPTENCKGVDGHHHWDRCDLTAGWDVFGHKARPVWKPAAIQVHGIALPKQSNAFTKSNGAICGKHGSPSADGLTCKCDAGYGGASCEQCANGYWKSRSSCKPKESCGNCRHGMCDYTTGLCVCPPHFKGSSC